MVSIAQNDHDLKNKNIRKNYTKSEQYIQHFISTKLIFQQTSLEKLVINHIYTVLWNKIIK